MKTAQDHLQAFIDAFKGEDVTFEDLKKFLTVTQQHECKFVNKISVEGQLMGINNLISRAKEVKIKPLHSTNEVNKDFVIKFSAVEGAKPDTIELKCRCIKEISVRKAGDIGHWGVNTSSFKRIE